MFSLEKKYKPPVHGLAPRCQPLRLPWGSRELILLTHERNSK